MSKVTLLDLKDVSNIWCIRTGRVSIDDIILNVTIRLRHSNTNYEANYLVTLTHEDGSRVTVPKNDWYSIRKDILDQAIDRNLGMDPGIARLEGFYGVSRVARSKINKKKGTKRRAS